MARRVRALIIKIPNLPFLRKGETLSPASTVLSNVLLPLGALYVATYARKVGGHDVEILDLNISILKEKSMLKDNHFDILEAVKKELICVITFFKPEVVGFSALFSSDYEWVIYCAHIVKSIDKKIATVVGGGLATIETESILSSVPIDYAILGEGERVFKNFLDCCVDRGELSRVKGLAFKERKQIVINERENLILDLDSIPIPDFNLVPMKLYPQNVRNHFYLFTSRGCPFKCKFCASFNIWGRKIRRHSVDRTLTEIRILRDTYNITRFDFRDDNLTLDSAWLKEFCQAIEKENQRSGIAMKWGCPSGLMLKTLDADSIRLMHRAGCEEFGIAIESGSERVAREIIDKPIDYAKVRQLRDVIKDLGAIFYSFYLFGLPGETIKEMQETVKFLAESNSDWCSMAIFTPFAGTELYRVAAEMGAINDTVSQNYYNSSLTTKDFSRDEVKEIQWDANIRYNFLRNRNLLRIEKGLQLEFYKQMVKHVIEDIDKHVIGKIVLGYVCYLDGMKGEAEHLWSLAKCDFEDAAVRKDFGKYMEWKEEAPIRKWREFIQIEH